MAQKFKEAMILHSYLLTHSPDCSAKLHFYKNIKPKNEERYVVVVVYDKQPLGFSTTWDEEGF